MINGCSSERSSTDHLYPRDDSPHSEPTRPRLQFLPRHVTNTFTKQRALLPDGVDGAHSSRLVTDVPSPFALNHEPLSSSAQELQESPSASSSSCSNSSYVLATSCVTRPVLPEDVIDLTSEEYAWLDQEDWLHPLPPVINEGRRSQLPRNPTFSRPPLLLPNGTITKRVRSTSPSRRQQRFQTFRIPKIQRPSALAQWDPRAPHSSGPAAGEPPASTYGGSSCTSSVNLSAKSDAR